MKKLLLLASVFFAALSLQSFTLVQEVSSPTKININTENPSSEPYIYNVEYNNDGSITVEVRCDHQCRVKVSPTRQILGYFTEAAKYATITYHRGIYNCYRATVTFSCSDGSVGSACRTYDFSVTEIL